MPMLWAERPGWRSIRTILDFVTAGSLQRRTFCRRSALAQTRWQSTGLYARERPQHARVARIAPARGRREPARSVARRARALCAAPLRRYEHDDFDRPPWRR